MNYRYSLLIQWSEEDQLYLVTLPDFAQLAMQPSMEKPMRKRSLMLRRRSLAILNIAKRRV